MFSISRYVQVNKYGYCYYICKKGGGEEDVENLGYLFLNMGIAMIFATKGGGGGGDNYLFPATPNLHIFHSWFLL